MTKDQLKSYIEINHHFMTIQEMADEAKEDYHVIVYICRKNNFKPITVGERIREVIKSRTDLTIEQQAEKLGMPIQNLLEHYYKSRTPLPKEKKKIKTKLSKGAQQYMNDIIKSCQPRKEVNRKAFTVYNQSGSNLLDEFRDIKTTDRNNKLLL